MINNMQGTFKKAALVGTLSFALSSCIWSSDAWKDYCTPELFLSHSSVHSYVTVSSFAKEGEILDYELYIKSEILKAGPFESVNSFSSTSGRYIAYEMLLSLATSGPNYTNMYIYDNGNLKIVFKQSLGSLRSFYFTFDAKKASALVDTIDQRIEKIQADLKEDQDKAKLDGGIEHFIEKMSNSTNIPVYCNGKYFYDDGTILSAIEDTTFTPRTEAFNSYNFVLDYNPGYGPVASRVKGWALGLYPDYEGARICYTYQTRYETEEFVTLDYDLSAVDGKAIYDVGLELSKKKNS